MKKILKTIALVFSSVLMAQQPNIVWITSEDNSTHYMKLYNENGIETPNISKLAAKGVQFNRAFSNAPVCSAARTTLITGVYGPKLASHYHRTDKKIQLPENIKMFPEYLRNMGYYTTNNSKEDYNVVKGASVWDESSRKATWKNRKKGQPFFHVQNFTSTHEGQLHFSAEKMQATATKTSSEEIFVQPNHPNTEVFKYTNAFYRDLIAKMDTQVGGVIKSLEADNLLEDTIIFYFGDHGGVLPYSKGYLKETGLHVPLVVYFPKKYAHLSPYKTGSKTDNFVSFVDFAATVVALAGGEIPKSMDGHPFFHHLNNAYLEKQKGEVAFGYSDRHGEKYDMVRSVRKQIYGYGDRFDEKYDMVRSVRKNEFKYIRNFQPYIPDALMNNYRYLMLAYKEYRTLFDQGKLNDVQTRFFEPKLPEELYDINKDPYETNNLANDPKYTKVLEELRHSLLDWMHDLPDLSLYPEHHLEQDAAENPIAFGKANKKNIHNYLKIANLQLLPFDKAKNQLKKNLKAKDPIARYWTLVNCSSFGTKAAVFNKSIEEIMHHDDYLLNRLRAAEFLGITAAYDISAVLPKLLYQAQHPFEALQILNTIVLMRDFHGMAFTIEPNKINSSYSKEKIILSRITYLTQN